MSMGGLDGLDELYEEIILDHYRNPRHAELLPEADVDVEVNNPFCGDEIRIQLTRDDGRIGDVSVSGRGCAISQASGSLLAELIEGKPVEEAREAVGQVRRLLQGEELSEAELDAIGDMAALQGVRKYPVRIKCALLSWSGLEDAVAELEKRI
jgi:nitrogen fixation NifU-like protein